MRVRYETQEMEQKINLLEQEQALTQEKLSRSKLFRNSLFGGFIALTAILTLLYLRYRMGKKYQEELKNKNKKLEELSKEKSEYLHIAAHDLKSPLSSILGLAELMKDEFTSANEMRQHAEFIYISAFRMHDLIKQFLNVDAIESGEKMVKSRQVDLAHSIVQVIEHFKYRAQWKDIQLSVDLPDGGLNVNADPSIFREIIDNLISNAVKYSPKGKQIWVKGIDLKQKIRIEVIDEGPGISEKDQQYLFQKFKRLTPEPTEGEGSTGLGLYIAKKMTNAMDGNLWCESDGETGSTFILELPKSS
jgi:signal transduction histidine kinase